MALLGVELSSDASRANGMTDGSRIRADSHVTQPQTIGKFGYAPGLAARRSLARIAPVRNAYWVPIETIDRTGIVCISVSCWLSALETSMCPYLGANIVDCLRKWL